MREAGRNKKKKKKKKCVDHILLKSLTTNVDLRTSSPTNALGKEDFRTYHQTMNSSSLAITMFRTPNVQTDDLNEKIRSNSSILLLLLYIKNITYLDRDLASSKTDTTQGKKESKLHNNNNHT